MPTLIHAQVPQRVWEQAQHLVEQGWAVNLDALVTESLRRYVDTHQSVLTEQFLRKDVEWGLDFKKRNPRAVKRWG